MAGYSACSDDQTLAQVVNPTAYSSATSTSAYVNFSLFKRGQYIVTVGAVGSGESITATVKQATSSTGAGAKAMNTPIALATAVTASNTPFVININDQSFDANNGFQWAALALTFVNSGTVASAETTVSFVLLCDPNSTPPTSVASQIVGAGITADY